MYLLGAAGKVQGKSARARYKADLVATLSGFLGDGSRPLFHVTAELPPCAGRAALDTAIRDWLARIDRHFLGRNWASPHLKPLRADGVIFYETNGGHLHAHMVIKPPGKKCSPFRFLMEARFFFQAHPIDFLRRFYADPVAPRGIMYVQEIGRTQHDLTRVLNYDAKKLENADSSISEWNFISHIASR